MSNGKHRADLRHSGKRLKIWRFPCKNEPDDTAPGYWGGQDPKT